MKAGYPEKMVKEIANKVQNSVRNINIQNKVDTDENNKIIIVSTHKADDDIIKTVKESEEGFKRLGFKLTNSFRMQRGPLFKFVKKVGPNIKKNK